MRNYNIFFTSDFHFSHKNLYGFVNSDGERERPFDNVEECEELIIKNWNMVVRPQDKVYILGDVCFNRTEGDRILPRLVGKKCLIKGNHDNFQLDWYRKYFYDVRGCGHLENFFYSHVPVHPDSKSRFKMNLHGHLHRHFVHKVQDGKRVLDLWYRNVCVDANDYKLVPFEVIQSEYGKYKQRGELVIPERKI